MRRGEEWLCLLKTTRARYAELERHLRGLHSYENPEIIATALAEASADYLNWLRAESIPRTGSPDDRTDRSGP